MIDGRHKAKLTKDNARLYFTPPLEIASTQNNTSPPLPVLPSPPSSLHSLIMLLANYASDSDSDGSGPSSPPPAPAPAPKPAPAKKKKPVKIALDLPRKDKVKSKSPEPDADADAGAAPSGDKPPPKRKLGGAGRWVARPLRLCCVAAGYWFTGAGSAGAGCAPSALLSSLS